MSVRAADRICFVGPMLGDHADVVPSPGEILGALFRREGYEVRLTSKVRSRVPRLADMLRSVAAWSRNVDVFIVLVYSGPSFIAADAVSALCRRLGRPLVLALHGGNLPSFADRHPGWVSRVLARADVVVAPSTYLGQRFAAHDPIVIPNVLDLDAYPFRIRREVRPRLLWMRTFHPIYDPQLALRALKLIVPLDPRATLTMAGQDNGDLAKVRRLAKGLELEDHVRFAGFLGAAQKMAAFAEHDIFLNTNRVDNMPVTVIEASASGLPLVATAVGGVPYLLRDFETGLLVGEGDAEAMASAVVRLLEDPALAERLSRGGRSLAEGFGWDRVRPLWQRVFDTVRRDGMP